MRCQLRKSLCYMTPPALVSKCQPRKMVMNVRPSHPHYHSADHDIWQILPILVTAIVIFFRILQQFEILWIHTDQCEDCFHYQSTVHNIQGSYWYFAQPLSWVGAWTLDYGVSISIFYNYLEFRNLCIHIDWCLSLDSLLPYSSHFFVYPVHSYHSYWP